jgi:hypothetical protein
MAHTTYYTEQILKELQALPAEALPKVLRLLMLVREEFLTHETQGIPPETREPTSHARTQQLLASSQSSWAQDLIAEREDRL